MVKYTPNFTNIHGNRKIYIKFRKYTGSTKAILVKCQNIPKTLKMCAGEAINIL